MQLQAQQGQVGIFFSFFFFLLIIIFFLMELGRSIYMIFRTVKNIAKDMNLTLGWMQD